MKNPFLDKDKLLLLYASIWVILSTGQISFETIYLDNPIEVSIVSVFVFNLIYMGIGISIWYPVRFIKPEIVDTTKLFINHAIAAAITSILWIAVGYFLSNEMIKLLEIKSDYVANSLPLRMIFGVLLYTIHASIYYLIIYSNNQREKEVVEVELRNLLKETELKSLKYQINPHFIFNSLNSIAALTLSDADAARDMTIKLSTYMRSTFSHNEKRLQPLEEELNNIRLYLEIETIRFGEKLNFIENSGEECRKVLVPGMILQPLIENAVKYGVHEASDKVDIKLSCARENEYLKIVISNNYDLDTITRKGERIGLKNIKQRLKLIYNQDNLLSVKDENGNFEVTIYLPIKN